MFGVKIIAVFVMGLAVGVLYRIPRNLILAGSANGMLAWTVMELSRSIGARVVLATFLATLAAGIAAESLARFLKKPATIFLIPGFIPLVPGREAYVTMAHVVAGQYVPGVATGVQALLTAGAIAFGIFVSSSIYRFIAAYRAGTGRQYVAKE